MPDYLTLLNFYKMKSIDNKELEAILGGSCPYCDGRAAGERFLNWIGDILSDMHEGMMMTQDAIVSHGI